MSTKLLLHASSLGGTEKFVFISTDKAVEPQGVMGASKALCESMVRQYPSTWPKKYILRFGNVLGSKGSVLKIWEKQLETGQPLTVTDLRMRRYCMTIPTACQLVLKSLEYPSGTFVLDMGKKVTVKDLLEDFLASKGKVLGKDSFYIENGIQPGEKMNEQLFWPSEKFRKLSTANIYKVQNSPAFNWKRLLDVASRYDDQYTLRILERHFIGMKGLE